MGRCIGGENVDPSRSMSVVNPASENWGPRDFLGRCRRVLDLTVHGPSSRVMTRELMMIGFFSKVCQISRITY